ncbi:aldo/keto reductase [Halogeometricum sp. S1BR25-6]|uniref:Aldo/keto reductase n=1 Tax=Halogeometricum salsisoli TaxID=2950536 RepID=A0ABU2GI42_9EURY|nr:aldo/keto reductase [Halogeometricum sp. S1BR25-6]MDS0299738.1 aldo/keto reductase [Halogeometricum sp. S1BR25-6]
MEYTTFGSTGVTVSELCLGCMSFGTDWDGWTLDREESRELIERAIDLGINFFDTANVYSYGESEEILGDVLAEYDRDEFVVATKVYGQMDEEDPNSGGLSRKTIEQELDNSLDRLGMDTVDLYQIHRWDYDTPIEGTMRALDDAVRRGKVRSLGASSMWAHQFAEALHTADRLGLDRFVSMQNLYNLAYREEEREMLPLCEKEDIAVMPWSPLGAGFLTRPHEEFDATTRGEHESEHDRGYTRGGGPEINERVEELATEKGVKMAQIAMAWQFEKLWVTTPILGTSSVEHLEDAVEALDIDLSDSDVEYLEEPYEPVPVSGHE